MSKVTVIVCHHKGDLIYPCIDSILKSRKIDFEIVIATSFNDLKYEHTKVRIINVPGEPSKKRNIASRYATGDYIAFFDDDTIVDAYALYEMKKTIRPFDVGMVFGKLKKMDNPEIFDEAGGFLTPTGFIWARGDRKVDQGQFNKTEPIFAGKSASCMIKRKVFWNVGAFDVVFGILGEESDLAWRVWLSGHKVMYCHTSLVLHAFGTRYKPMDFYSHKRIYYNGSRNYLFMLAANLQWFNVIRIVPINMAAWIVAGLGMFFKGKWKSGLYIFSGIFSFLRNFRYLSAKRESVSKIRKVSDKELFKTIMRRIGISYYFKRVLTYWRTGLHG